MTEREAADVRPHHRDALTADGRAAELDRQLRRGGVRTEGHHR
jgi:hypothetical protein